MITSSATGNATNGSIIKRWCGTRELTVSTWDPKPLPAGHLGPQALSLPCITSPDFGEQQRVWTHCLWPLS